jgi:hypothetical protein
LLEPTKKPTSFSLTECLSYGFLVLQEVRSQKELQEAILQDESEESLLKRTAKYFSWEVNPVRRLAPATG